MSLSNTGSSQKVSAKISYFGYIRPDSWCGVTWFAVPKWDQLQWATRALRGCRMEANGFGGGAGVKSQEKV